MDALELAPAAHTGLIVPMLLLPVGLAVIAVHDEPITFEIDAEALLSTFVGVAAFGCNMLTCWALFMTARRILL